MKSLYTLLILFLSTNFSILGSNDSNNADKKYLTKKPRPPFPAGHIPNFSNNDTSALSVFSHSLNSSSQGQKNLTPQQHQKKRVFISCAPLPICHENKPIDQSKSCLKQRVPQVSLEQQKLREIVFDKRKKPNDASFLIHKKIKSCDDCFFKYNHLQCAFLCNHFLNK